MSDRRDVQGKRPMGMPCTPMPPSIGEALLFLLTGIHTAKSDG